MIKLIDINENNFLDMRRLQADEGQQSFVDSASGILGRGYAWRRCNARVIGIADGERIIGAALVKDMDEEPACYDLQQFMIDRRFQNRGCGTEALRLILARLQREGKYGCVEVCVSQNDAPALRVYEKAGFEDTGYIDDSVPDCRNLMYYFKKETGGETAPSAGERDTDGRNAERPYSDELISDFSNSVFQNAFQLYFSELGVRVTDWEKLFREMNDEGGNFAIVRTARDGAAVGFIQFRSMVFASSFFEETRGFIRELWVAEEFRGSGQGSELLGLAEKYFRENGIYGSILTTDSAAGFYRRNGYVKAPGCKAKNQDEVFVKELR